MYLVLKSSKLYSSQLTKRCLVVCDGFYEWKRDGAVKQPYFIYARYFNARRFLCTSVRSLSVLNELSRWPLIAPGSTKRSGHERDSRNKSGKGKRKQIGKPFGKETRKWEILMIWKRFEEKIRKWQPILGTNSGRKIRKRNLKWKQFGIEYGIWELFCCATRVIVCIFCKLYLESVFQSGREENRRCTRVCQRSWWWPK